MKGTGFDHGLRFSFFLIETLPITGQKFVFLSVLKIVATVYKRDNCFAAPSSLRRRDFWGRSAGSFPKQLLVMEPMIISNTSVVSPKISLNLRTGPTGHATLFNQ